MRVVRAPECLFRAVAPAKYWKKIWEMGKCLEFLRKITDIEEYFPQVKFDRNYESIYLLILKTIYMKSI